jgi:hypothetical protein
MKAKEYADLVTLDQGRRPHWADISAYVDNELWSYKRWAWHFLQRNPKYQEVSIKRGPLSGQRAAQFGRTNLKPYKEKYTAEDDEKKYWLPERVSKLDSCVTPGGRTVSYELEFGEVALVIDLRRTANAGRAALTAMLLDARGRLDQELEKLGQGLSKSGNKLPQIRKPRRNLLLQRLRMCDAMWMRATDDELIRVFFAGYCRNGSLPVGHEREQVIRKVRRLQSDAIKMMDGGYLELIPLYYIQDKSTKTRGVPR